MAQDPVPFVAFVVASPGTEIADPTNPALRLRTEMGHGCEFGLPGTINTRGQSANLVLIRFQKAVAEIEVSGAAYTQQTEAGAARISFDDTLVEIAEQIGEV
jgi:hypothetical protein